jgi:adenine-specific DNA-methyltransferase
LVQIGPDNLHLVRVLLDEVFGPENCCATITVAKTSQVTSKLIPEVADFLVWYAKDKEQVKYLQLYERKPPPIMDEDYKFVEEPAGRRRPMTTGERLAPGTALKDGLRIYRLDNATSQGFSKTKTVDLEFEGEIFHPGPNRHWLLRTEGMEGLIEANRLVKRDTSLSYVRYWEDFDAFAFTNIWTDTVQAGARGRKKAYVVETNPKIAERAIAMTTQPGDLVIDPTCGSGTTAWACEKLGRRWITIDTSRVALSLARERLLTSRFDYFRLKEPDRGIDGGLGTGVAR